MKDIALKPRLSEKSYAQAGESGVYTFAVPKSVTKQMVKQAVEAQFEVQVTNVNINVLKGKTKQSYRKRSRAVTTNRNDVKKAYVKLAKGQTLPVFAAIEAAAEENTDKTAEKEVVKPIKEEANKAETVKKKAGLRFGRRGNR